MMNSHRRIRHLLVASATLFLLSVKCWAQGTSLSQYRADTCVCFNMDLKGPVRICWIPNPCDEFSVDTSVNAIWQFMSTKDSTLLYQVNYSNGFKQGTEILYSDSVTIVHNYLNGEPHGISYEKYPNSEVLRYRREYRNGKLLKGVYSYDIDGNFIEVIRR